MIIRSCALAILLSAAVVHAQNVKVQTTADKKIDFSALKTYSWEKGQESFDPASHKAVVASVDAELAKLGLVKQADKGDVLVRYHSVGRTSVDLKNQKKGESAPTYDVGKVMVELLGGQTFKRVWQATTEERLSKDPSARESEIQRAVARLFEVYPGRKKPA